MDGLYTITTTSAQPTLTVDDLIAWYKEACPTPRRQLDRFKEGMTERYGIDFETHAVVLSEALAEAIELTLPRDATISKDGVGITPHMGEGYLMLVMKKAEPFIYQEPAPLPDFGFDSFTLADWRLTWR